ncbi:hypothetical protein ACQY0O_007353 [Thecaphora frezii]
MHRHTVKVSPLHLSDRPSRRSSMALIFHESSSLAFLPISPLPPHSCFPPTLLLTVTQFGLASAEFHRAILDRDFLAGADMQLWLAAKARPSSTLDDRNTVRILDEADSRNLRGVDFRSKQPTTQSMPGTRASLTLEDLQGIEAVDQGSLRNATPSRQADAANSSIEVARSGSVRGWSPRWAPRAKRKWPAVAPERILHAVVDENLALLLGPEPTLGGALDPHAKHGPASNQIATSSETHRRQDDGTAADLQPAPERLLQSRSSPALADAATFCQPDFLTPRPGFSGRMESGRPSPAPSNLTLAPSQIQSNPAPSPALACLISSFPPPAMRDGPDQSLSDRGWDGGERWSFEDRKHAGERFNAAPYEPSLQAKDIRDKYGPSPRHLAPPRRLMAYEECRSTNPRTEFASGGRSPLKRLTLEGGPPSSPSYQPARNASKTLYKSALPLDPLASEEECSLAASGAPNMLNAYDLVGGGRGSESCERSCELEGSSSAASCYATATSASTSTLSLALGPSASTGEIARSLAIPRDAIKQMLETTQHVWRSHTPGALRMHPTSPIRLKRIQSSPDLSSVDSFVSDSERIASANDGAKSDSRRASVSMFPYFSSTNLSTEARRPGWAGGGRAAENEPPAGARAASLDAISERERFRQIYRAQRHNGARTIRPKPARPTLSRPIPRLASGSLTDLVKPLSKRAVDTLENTMRLGPQQHLERRLPDGEAQEVLMDLESDRGHRRLLTPPSLSSASSAYTERSASPSVWQETRATSRSLDLNRLEAMAGIPKPLSLSRLKRRNSEGGVAGFGPERCRRQPGELHAWSVVFDEKGFPTIGTSPSAFHAPACPLAGKGNATWQCGCRGLDSSPSARASISEVPRFGKEAAHVDEDNDPPSASASPNPGFRARSASLSTSVDDAHEAALWEEMERHRIKISRHQAEIDQLRATMARMSFEIASSRPSLSSTSARAAHDAHGISQFTRMASGNSQATSPHDGPPLACLDPYQESRTDQPQLISQKPLRLSGTAQSLRYVPGPDGSRFQDIAYDRVEPAAKRLPLRSSFGDSLRRRFSILERPQAEGLGAAEPKSDGQGAGRRRLRASASLSSLKLNRIFSFARSRRNEDNRAAQQAGAVPSDYPQRAPTPWQTQPTPCDGPQAADMEAVGLEVPSARGQPQPPRQHTSRMFPPSARKFSLDTLTGRIELSSFLRTHSRDHSSSSRASSNMGSGTTLDSPEFAESRFAFFPKAMRRWDSLSSRATSVSERSADRAVAVETKPNEDVIHRISANPWNRRMSEDSLRRESDAPPRRSSLQGIFEQPPSYGRSGPRPSLHLVDLGMAPISELSETGGTPTSLSHWSVLSGEYEANRAAAPSSHRHSRSSVRLSFGDQYGTDVCRPASAMSFSGRGPLRAGLPPPRRHTRSLSITRSTAQWRMDKPLPSVRS